MNMVSIDTSFIHNFHKQLKIFHCIDLPANMPITLMNWMLYAAINNKLYAYLPLLLIDGIKRIFINFLSRDLNFPITKGNVNKKKITKKNIEMNLLKPNLFISSSFIHENIKNWPCPKNTMGDLVINTMNLIT